MILFLETKFIRDRDQWNVVDARAQCNLPQLLSNEWPKALSFQPQRYNQNLPFSPKTDTIHNWQTGRHTGRSHWLDCELKFTTNCCLHRISLPPKLKLSTSWLTSNHPYLFCEDVCIHDIHHLLIRTGQIGTNLFHQPLLSCHTRVAITVLEEGSKVTLGQVSRQWS